MHKRDGKVLGIDKNVISLGWVSLFTDISSQMIFPLIPLFLANVLGAGKEVIGLIEGISESTASILKVFSGWLSDKLGKRKLLPGVIIGLDNIRASGVYLKYNFEKTYYTPGGSV